MLEEVGQHNLDGKVPIFVPTYILEEDEAAGSVKKGSEENGAAQY